MKIIACIIIHHKPLPQKFIDCANEGRSSDFPFCNAFPKKSVAVCYKQILGYSSGDCSGISPDSLFRSIQELILINLFCKTNVVKV